MKNLIAVFTLSLFTPVLVAETTAYNLVGGFHATASPSITTGEKSSAFVYEVKGASVLTSYDKKNTVKVSIDCLGFDELGSSAGTVGTGRCIWRDSEDHHLYVTVSTRGEKNVYTITGGTGKWSNASGEITTDITYLPSASETVYLGTDNGSGSISTSK